MASTSVFSALAALLPAPLFGGILRNLLVLQDCCRPTGSWLIAGTPVPKSDYLT